MKHIITITLNPSIDINTSVEYVIGEKKMRCAKPRYGAGGGGINVSRVIRRLGGKSRAFYFAGGPNGDKLQHLLDKEKIEHFPLQIKGFTRENISVIEKSSSRQFRFNMPGPEIEKNEMGKFIENIKNTNFNPDFMVIAGSMPPGVSDDFYACIVRLSKEYESKVIIDSTGKPLKSAIR